MKSFNHENRYDSLCIVFTIYNLYMNPPTISFLIKCISMWIKNEVNEHYAIMRGLILFLSATAIKINKKGKIFNRIQFRKQLEENYQNLYINYFIYRKLFPYTDIAQRCYIQELDKRCTKFLLQNVMYKFYIVCLLGPNAVLVFYFSIESCTDSFSISQESIFIWVEWVGSCYRWFLSNCNDLNVNGIYLTNFVKWKFFRGGFVEYWTI